jgi:nucleoside-diphosphate-sugar epimerase
MEPRKIDLFILGATGYIGKEVVREAAARGFRVTALVRSVEKAGDLAAMGARIVPGDAGRPAAWVREAAGCNVLLDLVQPALPKRIGRRAIRRIANRRVAITRGVLAALMTIPDADRPLLLSVSGLDDLAPDELGRVHAGSPLRTRFTGFAHIGIPVRRLIERSGVAHAFAYLGTVYGPGKAFAKTIFPRLAAGRLRMAGRGENRMPLVHVEDAARALVHLAALGAGRLSGHTFVVADGAGASMAEFLGHAAVLLGGPKPSSAPVWLARLFAGSVLCETLTRDIVADPASLTETGFEFRYPSYREGLPPTLQRLAYRKAPRTGILDSRGVFLALFVLAIGSLIAENCFNFPLSVRWMKGLAGGLPILDMRLGYSEGAAYRLFDVFGEAGRSAYLRLLWTVDLVLPTLFGLFLATAIRRGALRKFWWTPFLASACDYAENVAITLLLLHYPVHEPELVRLSSIFTVMKHALYATGVLLAIGGYVMHLSRQRAR